MSRRIAGVSQKMLTQTLRSLERDRLPGRSVTPSAATRTHHDDVSGSA
ncbi:winged helix-turn-helix transcriptional regulator [Kribbella sp. NPDC049174]